MGLFGNKFRLESGKIINLTGLMLSDKSTSHIIYPIIPDIVPSDFADGEMESLAKACLKVWGYDSEALVKSKPVLAPPVKAVYERLEPATMRKLVKTWLACGRMARAPYSDRIGASKWPCSTCSDSNAVLLAPHRTDAVQCGACVAEAIHGVEESPTGAKCGWCGDRGVGAVFMRSESHMTVTRGRCKNCARNMARDVMCWNCEKPAVIGSNTQQGSYRLISGTGRLHGMYLCEDCNHVDPKICQACCEQPVAIHATIDGAEVKLCRNCGTGRGARIGKCEVCKTQKYRKDLIMLVSSDDKPTFYCDSADCSIQMKRCRDCSEPMAISDFSKYGGQCGGCAGTVVSDNLYYHKENVLNHVDPKGRTTRKLGVELELEWLGSNAQLSLARALTNANRIVGDVGIAKRDGSLDAGVEIVTAPLSLNVHLNGIWQTMCAQLSVDFEARKTCGLHVHVSKAGMTRKAQHALLKLVYYNPSFWVRIAGRESEQYASIRDVDANDIRVNRYLALNTMNSATVEFRMFQASTDPEYIMSRIELCDAAVRFVCSSKVSSTTPPTTKAFYQYVRGCGALYSRAIKLFRVADIRTDAFEIDLGWSESEVLPQRKKKRASRYGGYGRPLQARPPSFRSTANPNNEWFAMPSTDPIALDDADDYIAPGISYTEASVRAAADEGCPCGECTAYRAANAAPPPARERNILDTLEW